MKQLMKTVTMKITLTALAFFSSVIFVLAQNSSSTTTTTKETTSFEVQPWMWIAGGALFILILVALLRGKSKDGVTVTKTTTVENSDV